MTGIPFHVMKEVIDNLKALEASEEAKNYLTEADSDEVVFNLLRGGKYNFSRRIYLFDNNTNVKEKMSAELSSIVTTLTHTLSECFGYENANLSHDGVFTDAMRERGYHSGTVTSESDTLMRVSFVNTTHGLFVIQ